MRPAWRRAPLGALCCVALLASGCGARAVVPAAEAPPPSPAAPGASAALVQTPPTVAAPTLPAALHGRWEPLSKALEGPGALTLSAATLAWSPCGPVPRAARAETVGSAVLLTLPGQPACRLDGQPVSHLRVLPRAGNACEMELSLYESAAQLAQQQRLAWGVYRRAGCQGAER